MLSLAALNPYRPRRWSGAVLTDDTVIDVGVLTPADRPASLAVDQAVVHNPVRVHVTRAADRHVRLAFDPEHRLGEHTRRRAVRLLAHAGRAPQLAATPDRRLDPPPVRQRRADRPDQLVN